MATLEEKEPTLWLLQWPDRLVLCSDEAPIKGEIALLDWEGEGKEDDFRIGSVIEVSADRIDMNNQFGNVSICDRNADNERRKNAKWLKVIAGHADLPQVLLSPEVASVIGWVDVEDLGVKFRNLFNRDVVFTYNPHEEYVSDTAFWGGFYKAQELNKNKFTEEDMRGCWELAQLTTMGAAFSNRNSEIVTFHEPGIIKHKQAYLSRKQQPKQWRVEVEADRNWPGENERPDITNNTIKVTKVIQ